jgi:hypothetical protein
VRAIEYRDDLCIILLVISVAEMSEEMLLHTCMDLSAISVRLFILEADKRLAWTTSFRADSNSWSEVMNRKGGEAIQRTERFAIVSTSERKEARLFLLFVAVCPVGPCAKACHHPGQKPHSPLLSPSQHSQYGPYTSNRSRSTRSQTRYHPKICFSKLFCVLQAMYKGVLRDDERRKQKMEQREADLEESRRKRLLYEKVQPVGKSWFFPCRQSVSLILFGDSSSS